MSELHILFPDIKITINISDILTEGTVDMDAFGQKTISRLESIDSGLRDYMVSTYRLIALGLLVTTLTAFMTHALGILPHAIAPEGGLTGLGWAIVLAPLGILVAMMFGAESTGSMKAFYWALVAIQGPSLALLTSMYTGASVVNAALATGCMFMGASLYGYTTKKDMTSFGSFLIVGLIGIVIASIINLFMGSSMVSWVISVLAVLIFTGLTVWETQQLRHSYDFSQDREYTKYLFAMNLYLNIINIFRALLSLFGILPAKD